MTAAHLGGTFDRLKHIALDATHFRPLGMAAELAWWERWLRTRGGAAYGDDYRARLDPARPLSARHTALFPGEGPGIRILDVGSGPLTVVGRTHPHRAVHVTAVDPLGRYYMALLRAHRVRPPTPVATVAAEGLASRFAAGTFDLVHARNAIDHSSDPLRAIQQMLRVARPGGFVHLLHHVDEAESRGHSALHQWNFRAEDGRFILWGAAGRVDVGQALAGEGETVATVDDAWVDVLVTKAPGRL